MGEGVGVSEGERLWLLTLLPRGVQLDLVCELCHERELIEGRRVDGLRIGEGWKIRIARGSIIAVGLRMGG
jgi:hypothetical protein